LEKNCQKTAGRGFFDSHCMVVGLFLSWFRLRLEHCLNDELREPLLTANNFRP